MIEPFEVATIDRRCKPRMLCNYPALIKGQELSGKKYRECGQLCNMSARGLYLISSKEVSLGDELCITITMTSSSQEGARQLSTRCVVMRVESLANDTFGVALRILHYRFL